VDQPFADLLGVTKERYVEELRKAAMDEGAKGPWPIVTLKPDPHDAVVQAWKQECERLTVDCGVTAAGRRVAETGGDVDVIRDKIAAFKATTLARLKFKAKCAAGMMLASSAVSTRRCLPPRRRNQSMSASEDVIRQRAYDLWDQAGRPSDRSNEFWFAAKAEFERKERTGDGQLSALVPRRTEPRRHEPAPSAPLEPLPSAPPTTTTATASEAQSAANALEALAASLKNAGGFYFAPSPAAIGGSKARKIDSVALSDNAEQGSLLKLTGGDPLAGSSGLTEGFSIRVPEAFEREASEHTVRVRVLARSANAASTRIAIAYSTAEVGNSGWLWRDVGANWAIFELVWRVPKMINGNGDYIGLLPDKPDAPGVEIHSVCASIF